MPFTLNQVVPCAFTSTNGAECVVGSTPVVNHQAAGLARTIVPGTSNAWQKEIGSLGRARTADPMINSHLLYQLSYQGIGANCSAITVSGQSVGCNFWDILSSRP